MQKPNSQLLRLLPSVSRCLASRWGTELSGQYGEGLTKLVLRETIERLRSELRAGARTAVPGEEELSQEIGAELLRLSEPLARHAINATGIILHTGLGRAPLSPGVVSALEAASGYTPVQLDLSSGGRSVREETIERYLCELTSFEGVAVMTNNAAATFVILHVLFAGKEVILSRGQLIEIGGSFRMPDVMAASGALLREVGTTNRTHLTDYEQAINERTGAILYVEPSNYRVEGFSGTPALAELCELGRAREIPVIADLGSGALVPLSRYGLASPLTIQEAASAGALISCSSGDKLIGGPQMGIICGSRAAIQKIRSSPFARMFRPDKLILAAMEETLRAYVNGDFEEKLPLYQIISASEKAVDSRATAFMRALAAPPAGVALGAEKRADVSYIGGGALPEQALPTVVVELRDRWNAVPKFAQTMSAALRAGVPPVVARVHEDALVFDLRTVPESDVAALSERVINAYETVRYTTQPSDDTI